MTEIIFARRTPVGRFLGGLAKLPAPALMQPLVATALQELPLDAANVDELLIGQVLTAGSGQAPARQAGRGGGLPDSVPATTVNKVCGSGLKAVMLADQAIRSGTARVIFAGGQESMSLAPHLLPAARRGYKYGEVQLLDHMQYDGLRDAYAGSAMGDCGELCAAKYKFSRAEQDAYALSSYQRARACWENGHFKQEVLPVASTTNKAVAQDEDPFAVDLERLSTLRPAFQQDGTITAGNASSISDGAALLVLTAPGALPGAKPLARIVAQASHAQAPDWFTTAPIEAIRKVCAAAAMQISDIDLFEINEAFAVVPMAAMRELELDHAKVNVCGGAVALGHPIGASGSRVLVTLLHALAAHDKRFGLAALCVGGGEACAMIVERLS